MAFPLARGILLSAFLLMAGTLAGAAPVLSASQFGDGSPVDTAVLGTRIPVVLVHGLGGSTEGWDRFLRAYEQNPAWRSAFKPYSFGYGTTTAQVLADPTAPRTISALGAALRDAMQDFYDKPAAAPDFERVAAGHDMNPMLSLRRGHSYLLALHNDTRWHHPMHLHGHSFRVIRRNGQPTRHQEWQDTVLMERWSASTSPSSPTIRATGCSIAISSSIRTAA